jgi:hypothetical protein
MLLKALRAWSPWSPGEGLQWGAVLAVGHILCLVAWWLVSREAGFQHQARWAALSVAGFVVVAYADVSWLLRARWAVIQRRRSLLPDEPGDPRGTVAVTAAIAPAQPSGVVLGEGLDHFHRPDCPLAVGKNWPPLDRDRAVAVGKRPCGMCEP